MSHKSAMGKALRMLLLGACAALITATGSAYAEDFQVLGASPAPQDSVPEMAASNRLILHDISLSGPYYTVDPASQPVLDYAVRLLQRDPSTVVYISGQGDRATVQRQARAVAQYLQRHGVAAQRLVLQDNAVNPPVAAPSADQTKHAVIVLNLSAPGCVNCPS